LLARLLLLLLLSSLLKLALCVCIGWSPILNFKIEASKNGWIQTPKIDSHGVKHIVVG